MNDPHRTQRYEGNDGATFEEIADELQLTPERVRQVQDGALLKMRVGLILIELLGRERAEPVLASLERAALPRFHRAMATASDVARRGRR
jgi:hypothetical protein